MNIGEQIINEIIKQGMLRVAHPDPDEPHIFVWNPNSYDQLSALVEEWAHRGDENEPTRKT